MRGRAEDVHPSIRVGKSGGVETLLSIAESPTPFFRALGGGDLIAWIRTSLHSGISPGGSQPILPLRQRVLIEDHLAFRLWILGRVGKSTMMPLNGDGATVKARRRNGERRSAMTERAPSKPPRLGFLLLSRLSLAVHARDHRLRCYFCQAALSVACGLFQIQSRSPASEHPHFQL